MNRKYRTVRVTVAGLDNCILYTFTFRIRFKAVQRGHLSDVYCVSAQWLLQVLHTVYSCTIYSKLYVPYCTSKTNSVPVHVNVQTMSLPVQ